ncbi:MAG: CAP domain-containing protein [Polyangiales bacterium]
MFAARSFGALALLVSVAWVRGDSSAAATASWASETFSPRPDTVPDPRDAKLAALCGGGLDAGLDAAASDLAPGLIETGELPDAQEIEFRQRMHGNPHVWARTWGARSVGGPLDRAALVKDVTKWLGSSAGQLRCGVGSVKSTDAGGSVREGIVVIAIDPVAELAAVPTKVSVGTWIDLDAALLGGGTSGKVVLLPPRGIPKTVLSSTTGSTPAHVRSRVSIASAGRWVVQIMADDGAGPRPVAEAEIYAGIEPPTSPPSSAPPGEAAGDGVDDPEAALLARLNGARAAESLSALTIDTNLAALAKAHALAMKKAKLVGHDVGDGDPGARVTASGATWKIVGENVAKARGERAAHRALYASPSHRAAMLEARFTKVGIAAIVDAKSGDVWVAELFGGP